MMEIHYPVSHVHLHRYCHTLSSCTIPAGTRTAARIPDGHPDERESKRLTTEMPAVQLATASLNPPQHAQ